MSHLDNYKNPEKRKEYQRLYKLKYMRDYYRKRRESGNLMPSMMPGYVDSIRRASIDKIGGPRCCECGCDEYSILEINHIVGGGRDERRKISLTQIYRKIIRHPDPLTEYNVLCRVCNALHYVRDIKGISGHTIRFDK